MMRSNEWVPSRATKVLIAAVVGLALIGLALFLILGRNRGLANQPGFLGTRGSLFADLNLVAQILLLVGLTIGFGFARLGNISAHQYNQTSWVFFNIVLVIFIMIVSFYRQVVPGIPEKLLRTYYTISTIHAVLGGITILFAIYLVLRMNALLPKALRGTKRWWKNLMRVTLGMYWLVGLFGIGTYYFWYVAPREATGAPETAAELEEGTVEVPVANYAYNPLELTIPAGTTVVFRNLDPDPHTITSDTKIFDGYVADSETYTFKFDQTGDFPYYCVFHGAPGRINMAGLIRVGEPAEVAAVLPTPMTPATPTPQPTTEAPPVAPLDPQAIGFGGFRDGAARSDEFELLATGLAALPAGDVHVWLTGEAETRDLGVVTPDAAGTLNLVYTDPGGENLLAGFSGFQVTVEIAGSSPASPSGEVVLENSVPAGTLGQIRQLLVTGDGVPKGQAYTLALLHQVENLFRHADAVNGTALVGDFHSLNHHIEHIFTIIDAPDGPQYRDFDSDGFIDEASDTFGLRNYLEAITAQAQIAAAAPDATENVKVHAAHVQVVAGNLSAWSDQIIDLETRAHQATSNADQQVLTAQALEIARFMLDGVDANGNGVIEPVAGEGGAYTAYFHSQYMAAMGVVPSEQ